jgi:hypothetical protein
VSVFLGNGDGTVGAETKFAAGSYPPYIAVGRFNGDNKQDIVVTNYGGFVSMLPGKGDGTFGTRIQSPADRMSSGLAIGVGEFTGNSAQDLVVTNYIGGRFTLLSGNGAGSFTFVANFATGVGPVGLDVADMNGDNFDDVVVVNQASSNVMVFLQQ